MQESNLLAAQSEYGASGFGVAAIRCDVILEGRVPLRDSAEDRPRLQVEVVKLARLQRYNRGAVVAPLKYLRSMRP